MNTTGVPNESTTLAVSRAHFAGALALLVFAVLAVLVRGPVPSSIDVSITRELQGVSWLRFPMTLVSVPGNGAVPYVLTLLSVLGLLGLGWRVDATFLALSTGCGAALNGAIKAIVARPRPTEAHVVKLDFVGGFSFPSGHVAFYVCYFGFLAAIAVRRSEDARTRRALTTLACVPIALVPFSRVYLGAHWATDTLGALLWSTTWLAFVVASYDVARQRRR